MVSAPAEFRGLIVRSLVSALASVRSLVKTLAFALATLQSTRLILKMMVSGPDTGGSPMFDCQIPVHCMCHLFTKLMVRYLAFLSLCAAPAAWQFTRLIIEMLVSAPPLVESSGLIARSLVHPCKL